MPHVRPSKTGGGYCHSQTFSATWRCVTALCPYLRYESFYRAKYLAVMQFVPCRFGVGEPMATLYSDIREDLLEKIKSGVFKEGEVIPSEVELAKQYGVSRPTIRQATQTLVDDGYLERRRRRGTIVKRPQINHSFTARISSFDDEMIANGKMPRTNVLMLRRVKPPLEVAKGLELADNEEVFKLVRLRFADDRPHEFSESYVPCSTYPDFDKTDFTRCKMYDVMRKAGHPVVSAQRRLEVVKADGYSSTLLELEEGDPLVILTSIGFDHQGVAREYTIASYQGETNIFNFYVELGGHGWSLQPKA